ncbi:MAG: DNA (cytosine-5-)-methyltransferase [Clostridia bacterium]|nr:DNA (cytosine-5-)-methyltransferase [Clostridia bacterium]
MYNIVELFSGIGSQAKALQNIGLEIGVLGTCEWDIHASIAYDAIHNSPELPFYVLKMSKEELLDKLQEYTLSNDGKEKMDFKTLKTYSVASLRRIYAAIVRGKNFVDVSSLTGEAMPKKIDILTYSFPCQDLSNVGAFHGYNRGIDRDSGSRSSLLWQVGRILQEMEDAHRRLPRYLLMENVPSLLSERHFANFSTWIHDLEELGYVSKYFELNAHDFGLPQNRPRLLMISVWVGQSESRKKKVEKYFAKKEPQDIIDDYKNSGYYREIGIKELFRMDYKDKKILAEAKDCNPNDTPSRRKIWDENPKLVLKGNKINPAFDMIRTITTKQDRNPNSGNLYFDLGGEGKSKFRYLTPRECLLFMGFTDEDYENIIKNNPEIHKGSVLFPRDKIIRMAGNSIPVKLLEGIFWQIKQIDEQVIKPDGRAR